MSSAVLVVHFQRIKTYRSRKDHYVYSTIIEGRNVDGDLSSFNRESEDQ